MTEKLFKKTLRFTFIFILCIGVTTNFWSGKALAFFDLSITTEQIFTSENVQKVLKLVTFLFNGDAEAVLSFIENELVVEQKQIGDTTFYLVNEVTDGDTIKIYDGSGNITTVRLLGIDTPETKDPREDVQCFGVEAYKKTKALVEGKFVKLESDPTQQDKDAYGRLLRFVYSEDGSFVNELLVQEGYAFSYREYPTQNLERFNELERLAREQNKGLWEKCEIRDR
jgi:endonuclease YncB( thermonuclease family)